MKSQLEKIIQKKQIQRKKLEILKNSYIKTIYLGILNGKSTRDIHKSIRKVTNYNRSVPNPTLEKYMLRSVSKIKSQVKKEKESLLIPLYFNDRPSNKEITSHATIKVFNRIQINDKSRSLNFTKIKVDEDKEKSKVLKNPRGLFYLCSEHKDCAEDHKKYQGKMYYNKNAKGYDKETLAYIKRTKMKSLQWVTGKPVWLVTRPNCRHYFTKVKVEEVLKSSVPKLIKKYDMTTKIGNYELQTKGEYYRDRLAYDKILFKSYPNDLLRKAIRKDVFLIKKWEANNKTSVDKSKK